VKSFEKIVTNIGAQLRLPKEDIEGIKLSAMGGSSKRDYLAFDCAMKDKGEVRYFLFHHILFSIEYCSGFTQGATVFLKKKITRWISR
jgi:hypothetical protein